jgi:flagellin-specific chaperone FliS
MMNLFTVFRKKLMLFVLTFELQTLNINEMKNFTTDNLAFAGYSQNVNVTNNIINGELTELLSLDKNEELEVVDFCNQFLEKFNVPKTITSFQKVERLLQHSSLEEEGYRENLLDWIATNWVRI